MICTERRGKNTQSEVVYKLHRVQCIKTEYKSHTISPRCSQAIPTYIHILVSCVNTLSIQKINQHRTKNNEEMYDFIIKSIRIM